MRKEKMADNRRYHWVHTFHLTLFLLFFVILPVCHADIFLDGSFGTYGPLSGPDYVISDSVGQRVGNNLFHSFSQFNVLTDQSATFTGPSALENVIGRVTGGSSSFIDGLLRCTIPDANLFLINPSGVMFGSNASLDIDGSFHVSTADFIRLSDGGVFYADPVKTSVLTTAPPSAFGFLSDDPQGIFIDGSLLQVPEGQTLSVVGGDIRIVDGELNAPGGRINLASGASSGEVLFHPSGLDMEAFEHLGEINLSQGTQIRTDGNGGGTVMIRGGDLIIEASEISSVTLGDTDGAATGVDIEVERLTLRSAEWGMSLIDSSTVGSGRGGSIFITASDAITMYGRNFYDYGSRIRTTTWASGDGGSVTVSTPTLSMEDGANIYAASFGGDGRAGDIEVNVNNLSLSGGSAIDTSCDGTKPGGTMSITATDSITISDFDIDGIYSTGFKSFAIGDGDGGIIDVSAATLTINGEGLIGAESFGDGRGGDIILNVGHLILNDYALIDSSNWSNGDGGNVIITATGSIAINDQGHILSVADGSGNAGYISMSAPTLQMDGGGISALSQGTGNGGDVLIAVDGMTMANGALISAESTGTGNAGSITVNVNDTFMMKNSSVSTEALIADGGEIYIDVGYMLYLIYSQITASVGGGPLTTGGNIWIDPIFVILNHSNIIANAYEGQGGNIQIHAGTFLMDPFSSVSASSALGIDGTVDISAPVINLSGFMAPLPKGFLGNTQLLRESCAVRIKGGKYSSLIIDGRDGLPIQPDGLLPSPIYMQRDTGTADDSVL